MYSAHSDNFYYHFFYPLSDQVEILWGYSNFFFEQMLNVSAFYLEKQKSIIPKKAKSELALISKQPALCTDPIFSNGFGTYSLSICT